MANKNQIMIKTVDDNLSDVIVGAIKTYGLTLYSKTNKVSVRDNRNRRTYSLRSKNMNNHLYLYINSMYRWYIDIDQTKNTITIENTGDLSIEEALEL